MQHAFLRAAGQIAVALALTLGLAACAGAPKPPQPQEVPINPARAASLPPLVRDIHSFALPNVARVTHVDLDLTADFAQRRLYGTASLTFAAAAGAGEILLDVKGLDIARAEDGTGQPLSISLGEEEAHLGQPLRVELPRQGDVIRIHYATRPDSAALQWLSPAQTLGKRQPFLFSQGQAILTRTWIPTQDSPGIRQTYAARIKVPQPLRAVMSAEQLSGPDGQEAGEGQRVYAFAMPNPVPPYLIALAIGDLAFEPVGERAGIYAEPGLVKAAAAEFADLPRMMANAEALYGPYRWGRYDVLVLPPSFPFGGMENPRLTFATPTVIAGDKSLVSLVAHELAHSWSGNLVTNATWSDFWLNEGFTTYFENRIMEATFGPAQAAMLANLGYQDLAQTIDDLGGKAAPDTRLKIDLTGRDPDDGLTDIAYEKGAAFLRAMEKAAGRARFDAYLRSYFDRFAFQPMTTEGFLADVKTHLFADAAFDFAAWAYQPGVPAGGEPSPSDALERAAKQAQAFAAGTKAARLDTQGWATQQWQRFLESLPPSLSAARLKDLDQAFQLSQRGNSEVLFAWLKVAIANRYEPALPALEHFLISQGRRKFVRPLFTALMAEGEWGPPIARRIYAQARPGYHAVTANSVDAIVR